MPLPIPSGPAPPVRRHRGHRRRLLHACVFGPALTGALAGLASCGPARQLEPPLRPLPQPLGAGTQAAPRVSGAIDLAPHSDAAMISNGRAGPGGGRGNAADGAGADGAGGSVNLDFADSDIRAVCAEILGNQLRVNYTIDPAVHGTATLRTTIPLRRDQLLPALRALLAQNNAALVVQDGLYRVLPANAVSGVGGNGIGETAVALRYTSAESLAHVLQPFTNNGGHIAADPGSNAIVVSGDPATREALLALVRAFDVDALAGQSYALLPVDSGSAKDFASALQTAFNAEKSQPLYGRIRVVPMDRIDSVLVVAASPRLIDDAQRVFELVSRQRRRTIRAWHVYYLQNSRSNDIANVLQQAFTPDNVTAQPTQDKQQSSASGTMGSSGFGGMGGSGGASGIGGTSSGGIGGGLGGSGGTGGAMSALGGATGTAGTQTGAAQTDQSNNPLLGGLGGSSGSGSGASSAHGASDANALRIIPNPQNNAVLVYATPEENDSIEAMLRKIDITPLQVRIDATIAEVTLNDNLQYGTQFFFKSGGVNGVLTGASQSLGTASLAATALSSTFPGFVIGGASGAGAPFVINALQGVTTVHVLSSPELMVVDNHAASLMVGSLVPYLNGTTTSVLAAAATTNSISYQPTGVILQVTPHVNNGGLVTLDISQQVSDVAAATTSTSSSGGTSINSPTFDQREVVSRVAVQDGDTVGLAGLISDTVQRGNSGIPWLKDIPLLGALAGAQTNTRIRTELLVLITPHVIHDQRDAYALTADLREQLQHAARVPDMLQNLPAAGSADPNAPLRRVLGVGP